MCAHARLDNLWHRTMTYIPLVNAPLCCPVVSMAETSGEMAAGAKSEGDRTGLVLSRWRMVVRLGMYDTTRVGEVMT